ncbi:MAG: hypothetical protein WA862_09185 [Solirubrobacterales bacterium]
MTTVSLTISIIAIAIVGVLAWNAFGGKEDLEAMRARWRNRGRRGS